MASTKGTPFAIGARVHPSFTRRIVLGLGLVSAFDLSGCFRSASGECDPFHPPPPYVTPSVTTQVSGAISVSFNGDVASVPLDGSGPAAGPSCTGEINGEPTIQTLSIVCTYAPIKNAQGEVVSNRQINIGYGPFDLRQLATGDTGAKVAITEWTQGLDASCNTTLERSITIGNATGSAAAPPKYVTADYVREGTVTLDLDAAHAGTWTTSLQDACAAPSLVIHLSATFTQRPGDYTEVTSPSCNLDISK